MNKEIIKLHKIYKNFLLANKNIKVLDVGAGSGYFVSSLIDVGFKDVQGVEVSKDQVKFGKIVFKKFK